MQQLKMEGSINWGLIGYGKFGKKIEDSFLTAKHSKLKAIASRSFEKKNDVTGRPYRHLCHETGTSKF